MFGNHRTYREYLDARIVALKQSATLLPEDVRPWGGSLDILETDYLRHCFATEGYYQNGNDWNDPVEYMRAVVDLADDLPEAPNACTCEGCMERLSKEQRIARQVFAKFSGILPAGSSPFADWAYCKKCGHFSRRAAEWQDGLCVNCARGAI